MIFDPLPVVSILRSHGIHPDVFEIILPSFWNLVMLDSPFFVAFGNIY
jgi:hypothetical protein